MQSHRQGVCGCLRLPLPYRIRLVRQHTTCYSVVIKRLRATYLIAPPMEADPQTEIMNRLYRRCITEPSGNGYGSRGELL